MQVDFDEARDKPRLPTIVVNPETGKKLKKEEQEMSSDEKIKHARKREEILDRKYEEYVLRESNRKLVD